MAKLSDGRLVGGETIHMSSGGSSIRFSEALDLAPQTHVRLVFPLPTGADELRASVVSSEGSVLRVKFENLTIHEQEVLTMVLYSRADSWLGWGESREGDNVLRSLQRIFQISMHGLLTTFKSLFVAQKKKAAKSSRTLPATTSAILLTALVLGGGVHSHAAVSTEGQQAGSILFRAPLPAPAPGQFRDVFSLADAGSSQIDLHGIDSSHSVYFTLPQTHVPRSAKLHLSYAFSPSLIPQLSMIKLTLL